MKLLSNRKETLIKEIESILKEVNKTHYVFGQRQKILLKNCKGSFFLNSIDNHTEYKYKIGKYDVDDNRWSMHYHYPRKDNLYPIFKNTPLLDLLFLKTILLNEK